MKPCARLGVALTLAAATVAGTACGGSPAGATRSEEILVFAAASLTESFAAIGKSFEHHHPTVRVRFNFGPSDGLATGIGSGAPADVFASASPKWMDAVADSPGVDDRAVFARNRLVVVVPSANPAHIRSLADLAKPGIKLVLAALAVPAGQYARHALAKAGLADAEHNVVSNEEDVKGVVQKVVLGEADAGIVYATDVTPAVRAKASSIPIPDELDVLAAYPIAVIHGTHHSPTARAFVEFVLGPGQSILRHAGFLPPP